MSEREFFLSLVEESKLFPPYSGFLEDLAKPRQAEEKEAVWLACQGIMERERQRWSPFLAEGREGNFPFDEIVLGWAPFCTPADRLKGPYTFLEPKLATEALWRRFYNLWILVHPERISAWQEFFQKGYQPPPAKNIPLLAELNQESLALDFADLGLGMQEPDLSQPSEESARRILGRGPFTWLADNLAALPYVLSSMPDISNVFSLATHVLSGGLGFVPADSLWSLPQNQLKVALATREMVLNDPLVVVHPQRDFLCSYLPRLIGVTLKPREENLGTFFDFLREGFTTFRLYDARSQGRLEEFLGKILRRLSAEEFSSVREKITIFAGQVTGVNQARRLARLVKEGGNGIGFGVVIGIGGGGICQTPSEAGLHVTNVNLGWEILREGFPYPVLFDGGVKDRLPVVLALGGAGTLKSQALAGGTLEQPPGFWYIRLPEGGWAKNYSGEAAARTKIGGGKVDFLGRPLFVEGADEYVCLRPDALTITDNTYRLLQGLATACVLNRVSSPEELQKMRSPPLYLATQRAKITSSLHHSQLGF